MKVQKGSSERRNKQRNGCCGKWKGYKHIYKIMN